MSSPRGRRARDLFRRAVVGVAAAAVAIPGAAIAPAVAAGAPASAQRAAYDAPDPIAAQYYAALLRHTRWAETVWDSSAGVFKAADFDFDVVLGNAVLLTHGDYDEKLAGVSKDVLRQQTVATIEHYAALNRLVNPKGTWGKQLFWDSTFESYFLDAGRLLWDDLDAQTQANLTTIAVGQAKYTADLDYGQDPLSGTWTADWPTGKYDGDTAQEESGVYGQALAPGLAWAPDDADAGRWSTQFGDWLRNAAGQPTADANNPAVVAGKPISSNTTHNIYDTYVVDNHGSVEPHYQSDIWRSGGRNAIQFILNDQPLPAILTQQPNSAELWRSLELLMSDQGEPFMPMKNDREFLYGRDVLPVAFVGQVLRDPDAVRAEANLADALADYQAYAPTDRLTKFSGEPKYEPEARAEIGIAYLLHVHAAESADGVVEPTSEADFFSHLAGVRDYGDEAGLTVQQSADAWAGASSRAGYVKFPWAPQHDSWLFYESDTTPFLYPRTSTPVDDRTTTTYTAPRDGFEGTASMFRLGGGYAGQVTLPTGGAAYASSGAGRDDGTVTVRNLDMSGYDGLDGSRTYTTAEGSTTESLPVTRPADPADAQAARVDDLALTMPVTARYVRMLGEQGDTKYGYSLYALHVYGTDGSATADLAAGRPATASSEDAANGRTAVRVTDGDPATRWAVSTAERTRADSWVQVDLGTEQTVGAVRLAWEAAAGARYLVQTSTDGVTWTTRTAYGAANPLDTNAKRVDSVDLTPSGASSPAPVEARYVRMQGVQGDASYGYSLYSFRAYTPAGVDAAAGRPATASSAASGNPASAVTDASATTRWAVSVADRSRDDSWLQVDLGTPTQVASVQLAWEAAAGRQYRVQTSLDGTTWTDAATFRYTGDQITSTRGNWLDVDGKAGFVVRGSAAPVTVSREDDAHHVVRLADSPDGATSPFLVEMLPGDASATKSEAALPQPTTGDAGLLASTLDGYLSLFNLTGSEITTQVTLPYGGGDVSLFEGRQKLGASSSTLTVTVPAGTAGVLAPRFEVPVSAARRGLETTVEDGRTLTVQGGSAGTLSVKNVETGDRRTAVVTSQRPATVTFATASPFPVQDLALSTITFPGSVLPDGMTSPARAVDGDPATSWTPGPDGRMVVDLGAARAVGSVVLQWDGTKVPASVVSVSDDGLTFHDVGGTSKGAPTGVVHVGATTRYVAVSTQWKDGDADLASLAAVPPGAAQDPVPALTVVAPDRTVQGLPELVGVHVSSRGTLLGGAVRVSVDGAPVRTATLLLGTTVVALPATLSAGRHTLDVAYLGAPPRPR
ncbi:discoidin domain-containing protein [Luteimicrobium album]|nr:discoidin domain-containing protein [Luteimicrobium album]